MSLHAGVGAVRGGVSHAQPGPGGDRANTGTGLSLAAASLDADNHRVLRLAPPRARLSDARHSLDRHFGTRLGGDSVHLPLRGGSLNDSLGI